MWSLHAVLECLAELGRADEAAQIHLQTDIAAANADVPIVSSCADASISKSTTPRSLMTTRLQAFTTGHLTIPLGFLLEGRKGTIKVPMTSYLVTHRSGQVVFDTGLHLTTQRDSTSHIGEFLAKFHEFDFHPGEDIGARLQAAGEDPTEVTHVVNSHLHFDHCGGNQQLENATIVVQKREWEVAHESGDQRGYVLADFDTGQDLDLISGEHDIFGDGSVVCFPTPGHTPGHQSLRVRTELGGEFVLCGDACHLRQSLDELVVAGLVDDPAAALASLKLFRRLQASGATIMFGHDPEFWQSVPQGANRLG